MNKNAYENNLTGATDFVVLSEFIGSNPSRTDEISILLINARSLVLKFHHLQFLCFALRPSFICSTETWMSSTTSDTAVSLPEYVLHRADRRDRYGGGCAIYSRKDIHVFPANDAVHSSLPESVWVSTRTAPSLLVGCLYNTPSTTAASKLSFVNVFSSVAALLDNYKLVLRDFNMSEVSWQSPTKLHKTNLSL